MKIINKGYNCIYKYFECYNNIWSTFSQVFTCKCNIISDDKTRQGYTRITDGGLTLYLKLTPESMNWTDAFDRCISEDAILGKQHNQQFSDIIEEFMQSDPSGI